MTDVTVICCSILRQEIEAVLRPAYPNIRIMFTDSMLHMHPEQLYRVMLETLAGLTDRPCLLVYGDCHAYMRELENRPNCRRTPAINCCDLLLGREKYTRFQKERAFLFLPEWTRRWREVFQQELGFAHQSVAKEFMQEYRHRLIYVDTGLIPVPEKIIAEISEFFEMPVSIVEVTLDHLRTTLAMLLKQIVARGGYES